MRRLVLAALIAASTCVSGTGSARVEAGSPYGKAQVYSAALRYLRVDLGYEVTEKDADAAYLMFRFSPEGRKTAANGSIQIVERSEGVRVVVELPALPRYHEQVLCDGLQKKLASEYGEPPHKAPSRPKDKADDKDRDPPGDDKPKDDKPKDDEHRD